MLKHSLSTTSALVVVAALSLAACSSTSSENPKSAKAGATDDYAVSLSSEATKDVCDTSKAGGDINYRVNAAGGLDPVGTNSDTQTDAAIYGQLVEWINSESKFEPSLAKSIESNADYTQWTLKLRDDVSYSDGTKLDSEAVVANLQRYLDPAHAGAYTAYVASISKMDTPDPSTVVFTLKRAWATFPWLLSRNPGNIINPKVLADPDADKLISGAPPANAGAGPYVFASAERGASTTLKKKANWWGGEACLDTIKVSYTAADTDADLQALRAGQVNAFLGFDPQAISKIKDDPSLNRYLSPVAYAGEIVPNVSRKPLDDVRIRQAMEYALDDQVINSRNWGGAGLTGRAIVPPYFKYQPTVAPLAVDATAGKKLVDAAKSDGVKTSFSYKTSESPVNTTLAILQAALFKNVGLGVKAESMPILDFYTQFYAERNFEAGQTGLTVTAACPYCGLSAVETGNGSNFGNFSDPELDAALKELQATPTGPELVPVLDKVQKIWNDVVPVVFAGWLPQLVITDKSVHGLHFTSDQAVVNFADLYVKK
jgi:peptide/nickel transport system substrate-binding protein